MKFLHQGWRAPVLSGSDQALLVSCLLIYRLDRAEAALRQPGLFSTELKRI